MKNNKVSFRALDLQNNNKQPVSTKIHNSSSAQYTPPKPSTPTFLNQPISQSIYYPVNSNPPKFTPNLYKEAAGYYQQRAQAQPIPSNRSRGVLPGAMTNTTKQFMNKKQYHEPVTYKSQKDQNIYEGHLRPEYRKFYTNNHQKVRTLASNTQIENPSICCRAPCWILCGCLGLLAVALGMMCGLGVLGHFLDKMHWNIFGIKDGEVSIGDLKTDGKSVTIGNVQYPTDSITTVKNVIDFENQGSRKDSSNSLSNHTSFQFPPKYLPVDVSQKSNFVTDLYAVEPTVVFPAITASQQMQPISVQPTPVYSYQSIGNSDDSQPINFDPIPFPISTTPITVNIPSPISVAPIATKQYREIVNPIVVYPPNEIQLYSEQPVVVSPETTSINTQQVQIEPLIFTPNE